MSASPMSVVGGGATASARRGNRSPKRAANSGSRTSRGAGDAGRRLIETGAASEGLRSLPDREDAAPAPPVRESESVTTAKPTTATNAQAKSSMKRPWSLRTCISGVGPPISKRGRSLPQQGASAKNRAPSPARKGSIRLTFCSVDVRRPGLAYTESRLYCCG